MEFVLLSLYTAFFLILSWRNFRLALGLLIVLLPAYLLRFNMGPVPSTILELNILSLALVWLLRYVRTDLPILRAAARKNRIFFIFIFLFLAATFIAALANPLLLKALGIWRAYFLEPIILFAIIVARQIDYKFLRDSLAISAVSVALLAIIQKIFGGPFPPTLWDDELFGRPTSFFTTPNAIGLFLVPIALLLANSVANLLKKQPERGDRWRTGIFVLCVVAIIISFSQGAWAALIGGLIVFGFLAGKRRLAASIIVMMIFGLALVPNIRSAFMFADKAGQNRLTLWKYSAEYLIKSPSHFVLGSGLRMFFNEVQRPHYNVEEMERLIYPHNIILNFWLETGLLGAITFFGLLCTLLIFGYKIFKDNNLFGAAAIGALAAFVIHGLVDVPYFKNDLAVLFWLLAAVIFLAKNSPDILTKDKNLI
jgi:O-antigen ligase